MKFMETMDFESQEIFVRNQMLELGRKIIERAYNKLEEISIPEKVSAAGYQYYGKRSREILTLLGSISIKRDYYYNHSEGKSIIPFDEMLRIRESSYSPGVQRAVAHSGSFLAFAIAEQQIKELAGIQIDAKTIERITKELGNEVQRYNLCNDKRMPEISSADRETLYLCMDGTGIPMNKKAVEGRKGKMTDQAKTREVKLGCIFTQTGVDDQGYPVRLAESTTYWGGIINAEEFGRQTELAAAERKAEKAAKMCVIGDGAAWIWNIAEEYFPHATQIVDLFHAREHYWEVARMFFPEGSPKLFSWTDCRKKELDAGDVGKVIKAIARLKSMTDEQRKSIERAVGYFSKHSKRMRYNMFRENHLFVGSGVLEAGCRSVVGQRMKQSGMHWSMKGADSMIALRCCIYSGQWEDFWEKRAA